MGLLDRLFGKKQLQLVEVVELTSTEVIAYCVGQVRAIIRQYDMPTLGSRPDEFNKNAWNIVLELTAFSLHLADRIAFNTVGPEKRSRFMDALLGSASSHLAQILTDTTSKARQQFGQGFLKLYDERTRSYAPLQLPSDGEGPLTGTLFWEAAKEVAHEYFPNDASKATLVLSINFGLCVEAVKDLSARLAAVHDLHAG